MVESSNETCEFHNINLQEHEKQTQDNFKKQPKRILKFSDGVLEEYSSEDETDAETEKQGAVTINPKTLNWLPWTWYQTVWVSGKILEGCDTMGEYLAEFFGITTPKYQFEIDEYYRMKTAEEDMLKKEDLEMGGWTERNKNNLIQKTEVK